MKELYDSDYEFYETKGGAIIGQAIEEAKKLDKKVCFSFNGILIRVSPDTTKEESLQMYNNWFKTIE